MAINEIRREVESADSPALAVDPPPVDAPSVFPPPLSEPQKHFEPRRTETAATSTALRSKVPFIYQTGGDGTNWYKVKNQFGDEPGLTPELVSDICRQKRL